MRTGPLVLWRLRHNTDYIWRDSGFPIARFARVGNDNPRRRASNIEVAIDGDFPFAGDAGRIAGAKAAPYVEDHDDRREEA